MRSREYWDDSFEARYAELRKDPTRPPLKVIITVKLLLLCIPFVYS